MSMRKTLFSRMTFENFAKDREKSLWSAIDALNLIGDKDRTKSYFVQSYKIEHTCIHPHLGFADFKSYVIPLQGDWNLLDVRPTTHLLSEDPEILTAGNERLLEVDVDQITIYATPSQPVSEFKSIIKRIDSGLTSLLSDLHEWNRSLDGMVSYMLNQREKDIANPKFPIPEYPEDAAVNAEILDFERTMEYKMRYET